MSSYVPGSQKGVRRKKRPKNLGRSPRDRLSSTVRLSALYSATSGVAGATLGSTMPATVLPVIEPPFGALIARFKAASDALGTTPRAAFLLEDGGHTHDAKAATIEVPAGIQGPGRG